jgi:opacity protein-like surface antigen
MKSKIYRLSITLFIGLLIISLNAITSFAAEEPAKDDKTAAVEKEFSRKGRGEFFIFGQQWQKDTTYGTYSSVKINMGLEDSWGYGIGTGVNFNDYIGCEFDFGYRHIDLQGRAQLNNTLVKMHGDADALFYNLNLNLNLLPYRLTPMITGGVGVIMMYGKWDGGEKYGDTLANETDFSYNIGAGIRYDVTNHLVLKVIYRATWMNMKDTDKTLLLNGVGIYVGF